jgi:hypothetical protein
LVKQLKERFFQLAFWTLLLTACARPGTPTGGPQDTEPPKVVSTNPPDKSLYFTGREINITFDEYIALKDIQKQLLISPPLKEKVQTVLKKKTLIITFQEDLKDSTTYTFSFGKSITDLNEGNVAAGLRYVVSTGSFLDSLGFIGRITDAFTGQPEKDFFVLLYEVSDTIAKDSVLYNAFPDYFAITDDQGNFEFENLRLGTFWIFGLFDKNSDYKYNGPPEKIALFDGLIQTDSVPRVIMEAFLERPKLRFLNAQFKEYGRIDFNFNMRPDSLRILEWYEEVDSTFDITQSLVPNPAADTLSFWFAPKDATNKSFLVYMDTMTIPDTANTFLRASKMGAFKIEGAPAATLHPGDTFSFNLNHPLATLDPELFEVLLHDSIPHPFTLKQHPDNPLKVFLLMERNWEMTFKVIANKGAFKDIFGQESDSTGYSISTKTPDDYGNWKLSIEGDSLSYILELLNEKGEMLHRYFFEGDHKFEFKLMVPGKYRLRVINDINRNNKWDTGSLQKWRFPEPVQYNNEVIEIRANWDIETTWDIKPKQEVIEEEAASEIEAAPKEEEAKDE